MIIIEILKAALFGLVEGITEWLPVSSTGHLILLNEFVKLNVSEGFWELFEVVIQLGAIMAVVIIFWNKLWPFRMKNEKIPGKAAVKSRPVWKDGAAKMWIDIIIACIPAAIVGVLFDDEIDVLFYHPVPVALALIIVGVIFIVIELLNKNKAARITDVKDISYMTAFLIGIAQLFAAIFPGTSRSGATIIGALLLGVSRECAAEFTFFLAVPVMLGASLLKCVKFAADGIAMTGVEVIDLIVGCAVAFFVSVAAIRFLMGYVKNHDFKVFGFYRIALGIIVLIVFL